ncbi:MAG: FtsK/SpoIIIE domain-containing protein [Candidatus Dormibacteraeota bacterium]|nr:FtsK/SpoIIIE domain-containing protein [Candidatus Dormibacteraeota bacterium]
MGGRYLAGPRALSDPGAVGRWVLGQPVAWVPVADPLAASDLHWGEGASSCGTLLAASAAALLTADGRGRSPAARLRRAMVECGVVGVDETGRVVAPGARSTARWQRRNVTLRWRMPPVVTLWDVPQRQEPLEARSECSLRVCEERGGLVTEVLRHRIPDHLSCLEMYSSPRPPGRYLIGLGRGRRGSHWVDLDARPHLLAGGMTGGGKPVFLRQVLTVLCREHEPEDLQVALIDLQGGVELAPFRGLPHAIYPLADGLLAAAETLERVRQEVDQRLREVREAASLERPASPPSWPRLLVVVDEVARLTCLDLGDGRADRAAQQAASGRLGEIARLGRSVGVHLVCCTQRQDAEAMPGQLRANLQGAVAFRVRAAVNSHNCLDSDRAALLPPHSPRAIWREETLEEFQAVECSLEGSHQLPVARWSGKAPLPPRVPVTQWWENTHSTSDGLSDLSWRQT